MSEATCYVFSGGDLEARIDGLVAPNLGLIQWVIVPSAQGDTILGHMHLIQYTEDALLGVALGGRYKTLSEVPPFEVQVLGKHQIGLVCGLTLQGVRIKSETSGFSYQDLGNTVRVDFSAEGIDRWKVLEAGAEE